jgi:hypothetical protein
MNQAIIWGKLYGGGVRVVASYVHVDVKNITFVTTECVNGLSYGGLPFGSFQVPCEKTFC